MAKEVSQTQSVFEFSRYPFVLHRYEDITAVIVRGA